MRPTLRLLIPLTLSIGLIVAACSDGGAASAPPADTPGDAPSDAAMVHTLDLADSSLGAIVVDADGRTLYGFAQDSDGMPTCYDSCAANWPPLLVTGELSIGDGLNAGSVGEVDRTDGTTQVVYGGWPLYYFASDSAAGDTNGQGVGDVWYVIGANGEFIQ